MERVTVGEAARRLGLSEAAIRKRIARNTLASEADRAGRRWVLLEVDAREDAGSPTGQDPRGMLIEQLASEVRYLREENRRKDHLLAAALERIPPQLEAASEEDTERPSGQDVGQPTVSDTEDTQGRARSWWQRLF